MYDIVCNWLGIRTASELNSTNVHTKYRCRFSGQKYQQTIKKPKVQKPFLVENRRNKKIDFGAENEIWLVSYFVHSECAQDSYRCVSITS